MMAGTELACKCGEPLTKALAVVKGNPPIFNAERRLQSLPIGIAFKMGKKRQKSYILAPESTLKLQMDSQHTTVEANMMIQTPLLCPRCVECIGCVRTLVDQESQKPYDHCEFIADWINATLAA